MLFLSRSASAFGWKLISLSLLVLMSFFAPVKAQINAASADAVVYGRVFEETSGEPLLRVTVTLDDGTMTATTDTDGRFRLTGVSAGTHTIKFSLERYQDYIITDLLVDADAGAEVDVSLTKVPLADTTNLGELIKMEAFKVGGDEIKNSATSLQAFRKRAPISMDVLSAAQLSRFPVSDVSEAMVRIPGVSKSSQGSFAVIRGMGERYNSTTVNGIPMPSSDPERQSIELDIFPTRLLDALVVYKSFSADLPGNLSGGGIDIRLATFPDTSVSSITIGSNIDQDAIDRKVFYTYPSEGEWDYYGRGSKGRLTRPVIPPGRVTASPLPVNAAVPLALSSRTTPFGAKFALYHGNTVPFPNGWQLGYNLSVAYDSSYSNETGQKGGGQLYKRGTSTNSYRPQIDDETEGRLAKGNDYYESEQEVSIGVLMNLGLKFSPEHQITATGFSSQVGIDRSVYKDNFKGYKTDSGSTAPSTVDTLNWKLVPSLPTDIGKYYFYELNYRERNVTDFSLSGQHKFPFWKEGQLDYTLARVSAYQDEPDFRRLSAFTRDTSPFQYEVKGGNDGLETPLNRFWRKTDETLDYLAGKWTQPVLQDGNLLLKVQAGADSAKTERIYEESVGLDNASYILEDPRQASLYMPTTILSVSEITIEREITAAFAAATFDLFSKYKFTFGARAEQTSMLGGGYGGVPGNSSSPKLAFYEGNLKLLFFEQPFVTTNPQGTLIDSSNPANLELARTRIDQTDWLPSVMFTWAPSKRWNVRAGWSRTIARPSIREVSNYFTVDHNNDWQYGNAFLKISDVENYDVRVEHFFAGADLFALSAFRKSIKRPIEKTKAFGPAGGPKSVETWINNNNTAELRGVEFEFRKNLGFLWAPLGSITLGGNATWIEGEVAPNIFGVIVNPPKEIREKPADFPKQTRPLYDQPEWLLNADVSYAVKKIGFSTSLSFFATSQVLSTVQQLDIGEGFVENNQQGDEYLASYHRVDLTVSQQLGKRFKLRLTAKNLTDPTRKEVIDEDITGNIEIITSRWKDGRSYSISLTTDF